MMIAVLRQASFCSVLLLAACGGGGGGGAEPETPADAPESEGADADADEGEASGEASADDDAESPDPEASSEPEPSGVNPEEVLVREGTTFMINHRESDMGKKAEEKCAAQAGDDVAKKANCLSKAINNMEREGLMFDQDGDRWWIIRIGIVKGAKFEYNKKLVEVGEPSGSTITLKTIGKDEAKRRKGTLPSELKFEIPDEYTVILHHPDKGKIVYEPKLGMFKE